jgi:hypothetical protein
MKKLYGKQSAALFDFICIDGLFIFQISFYSAIAIFSDSSTGFPAETVIYYFSVLEERIFF